MRIEKVHLTGYQAEGKGARARLTHNKRGLKPVLNGKHLEQWDIAMSDVMFSYKTSINTAKGFTPKISMFGKKQISLL